MKKLRGSLAAKITAIVLLCLLVLAFVASAVGAVALSELGAYSGGYESARQTMLDRLCRDRASRAAERVLERGDEPDSVYAHENFRFVLYDADGQLLYSNYDGSGFLAHVSRTYETYGQEDYIPIPVPTASAAVTPPPETQPVEETQPPESLTMIEETEAYIVYVTEDGTLLYEPNGTQSVRKTYRIEGYIPEELSVEDEIYHAMRLYTLGYSLRYVVYAVAAVSLLLGILLFIFLCSAAGHRDAGDTITPNFVDRIPFDLLTAAVACGVGVALALLLEAMSFNGAEIIAGAFLILAAGLLFLLWCMSLATRVKCGGVLRSCLCYRLLAWCGKWLGRGGRALAELLRSLPLIRKWAAILAAVWLGELFVISVCRLGLSTQAFFFWVLEHLLLTALAFYLILSFRRLRLGAKAIAAGDERCEVDTRGLVGELAEHANDLNHIRDGLSVAVAERMKSERLRTELITNVSHDIKTPLTSIVNYVDLLAREAPENEKSREYLEVLQRQSARMKKLIDDLIEASKASTGSLPVEKERCELGVLLDQTAGEYGEKLAAAGLELILQKPEAPVSVLADGRHMWRIFDNLLQNVVKYAQPGTRVYLSLERREDRALVTLRNISRGQLNVSGEELLERFVRGDSSRNTEGSGLGLSIARSLAQLQGGEMDLTVDGDLFKVTLRFPALP
ncbi:MAG: hypothetical protein IJ594_08655 [Oscillospiraceae bacterium]|nr:hypothetical protein [Oscillospiraceae bacterium]